MQAITTVDILSIEHTTQSIRCISVVCTDADASCRVHIRRIFLQIFKTDRLALVILTYSFLTRDGLASSTAATDVPSTHSSTS